HPAKFGDAVETANSTDSAVPLEDTLAQVTGIGAKLPLLDTPIGTEREPPRRNFEIAPTAEAAPARPLPQFGAIHSPAGHRAFRAHEDRIQAKCFRRFEAPFFGVLDS